MLGTLRAAQMFIRIVDLGVFQQWLLQWPKLVNAVAGVCVGKAASLRQFEFPGDLQFYGALSAVGPLGILAHSAQQCSLGSLGHCGR